MYSHKPDIRCRSLTILKCSPMLYSSTVANKICDRLGHAFQCTGMIRRYSDFIWIRLIALADMWNWWLSLNRNTRFCLIFVLTLSLCNTQRAINKTKNVVNTNYVFILLVNFQMLRWGCNAFWQKFIFCADICWSLVNLLPSRTEANFSSFLWF